MALSTEKGLEILISKLKEKLKEDSSLEDIYEYIYFFNLTAGETNKIFFSEDK